MIFPLSDSTPRIHQPLMTWGITLVTAAVFLLQQSLPPWEFYAAVRLYGLIPAALPESNTGNLAGIFGLFTYMFLHTGWWHAIGNLWMLRIFGDNVEDVMGPGRFFLFYLACGIVAGLAHVVMAPHSATPVVGASGAISGVLGAYFLLYPHARVTTFVFFFIVPLPAAVYLGGWFALQLFSGLGAGAADIAWWAHLGGFVAGMVLLPFFRANRPLPATLPQTPPLRKAPRQAPWERLKGK